MQNRWYIGTLLFLGCIIWFQHERIKGVKEERNKYEGNTNALLSEIKRIRVDSSTQAIDVQALKLSLDEYRQYRASDLEQIKGMKAKINDLQAAARHEVVVEAHIDAELRDSTVFRDSARVVQAVKMDTPHLYLNGIIDQNRLVGDIKLPVVLRQAIWLEYKHKFLWWKWKVKAVHQTISSDNPFVSIQYSEFIQIKN